MNMTGQYLLTFDPASPVPIRIQPCGARAIIYAPRPGTLVSPLVVLDARNELYVVSLSTEAVEAMQVDDSTAREPALAEKESSGLFSSVFGKTERSSMEQFTDTMAARPNAVAEREDFWTLPAHVMPNVNLVYTHFMASLLAPATPSLNAKDMDESANDVDTTTSKHLAAAELAPPATTFMVIGQVSTIIII